jgi:hypothetical protein
VDSHGGHTARGPKILAYGRDLNFPGWPDTLQLNYANPELQRARIDELVAIAGKCDGVRCDMAMLLLSGFSSAPGGSRPSHSGRRQWQQCTRNILVHFHGRGLLGPRMDVAAAGFQLLL